MSSTFECASSSSSTTIGSSPSTLRREAHCFNRPQQPICHCEWVILKVDNPPSSPPSVSSSPSAIHLLEEHCPVLPAKRSRTGAMRGLLRLLRSTARSCLSALITRVIYMSAWPCLQLSRCSTRTQDTHLRLIETGGCGETTNLVLPIRFTHLISTVFWQQSRHGFTRPAAVSQSRLLLRQTRCLPPPHLSFSSHLSKHHAYRAPYALTTLYSPSLLFRRSHRCHQARLGRQIMRYARTVPMRPTYTSIIF